MSGAGTSEKRTDAQLVIVDPHDVGDVLAIELVVEVFFAPERHQPPNTTQ